MIVFYNKLSRFNIEILLLVRTIDKVKYYQIKSLRTFTK